MVRVSSCARFAPSGDSQLAFAVSRRQDFYMRTVVEIGGAIDKRS